MPKENIERAIKKALGLEEGTHFEEAVFEGYGPGGVAILINTITDNRRRTVSELRHLFSKYGGNLAEPGAVAWIFEKKGLIVVPRENEEKVLEKFDEFEVYDYKEAIKQADIIVFLVAHKEFKLLFTNHESLITNKQILDFCGIK